MCALAVKPEQQGFVAPNSYSLAEAYLVPEAWPRVIYVDDEPVGFLMFALVPDKAYYYLWRFTIDAAHQGRGYGKQALELAIEHVRSCPMHAPSGSAFAREMAVPKASIAKWVSGRREKWATAIT